VSKDAKKMPDNVIEMPDIYTEEFSVDDPTVEVVVLSSTENEEPEGFNPYDTARLYKK
jgi:hypothetical protein